MYVYMYAWVPSLSTWNHHNIVNRLYPMQNKKLKKKKEYVWWQKLTRLIEVINLQYKQTLNSYAVYLKLTMLAVNHIAKKQCLRRLSCLTLVWNHFLTSYHRIFKIFQMVNDILGYLALTTSSFILDHEHLHPLSPHY